MIKERDVAENFKRIWSPYPLHTIVNTAEAGWPDRFLQLSHSTVVAVEFKLLQCNRRNVYKLTTFKKEQAAWFAKWQRFGGYCMLFCGVTDYLSKLQGYDMVTFENWRDWIKANDQSYVIGERELVTTDTMIRTRLREWLQTRRLHANVITGQLTDEPDSSQSTLQERVDA